MLFQAMVIFLHISIFFKILSERRKVHLNVSSSALSANKDRGGSNDFWMLHGKAQIASVLNDFKNDLFCYLIGEEILKINEV